jgi:very-short-patch-repair endonuclease
MAHSERMPANIERLRAIAAARHGVISRAEALEAGFSYPAIRHRIDCGMWARSGRALIIRDLHLPGDAATAWILHIHVGTASRISGPLAMRLQGWHVPGEDHLVAHPSDVQASIDLQVRILRRSVTSGIQPPGLPPLVPRLESLADTLACRSATAARDLLDHALQRRWIGLPDIDRMLEQRSGPGPRGQDRLRELRARAASGSRSEAEQRMGALLRRGPGRWIANYAVRDEAGRILAEIDFADPHLMIAIEVDGRAFHSDRRSFERDRERQNALALRGWIILRFTWERLVNDPDGVLAEITAAQRGRVA